LVHLPARRRRVDEPSPRPGGPQKILTVLTLAKKNTFFFILLVPNEKSGVFYRKRAVFFGARSWRSLFSQRSYLLLFFDVFSTYPILPLGGLWLDVFSAVFSEQN
jgi:hypothetical protein